MLKPNPLFGFRLCLEHEPWSLVSLRTSRLLSWTLIPYSTHEERRSTSRGNSHPATFRPQGLDTLSTVCSLRSRAGFVSCRRRSWDSPFEAFPSAEGIRPFPAG